MNRGMYGTNNGVIGNIWRQKVSSSAKQDPHPISQLDEDTYNLFNAWNFNLPDNADDINNFIINLKCELGIQQLKDVFDCFYILAAATQSQSLINWAQPGTYDLTIGNSGNLTFTILKGWRTTGVATTGFLNTNFNPNAVVCNFNNNVEPYDPTKDSATQSAMNYGGSWGFYTNEIPTRNVASFVYDIGSSAGANGNGNVISILSQSGTYQLQSYGTRTSVSNNNPVYGGTTDTSQLYSNPYGFYSMSRENNTLTISGNLMYNYHVNGMVFTTNVVSPRIDQVATASTSAGPIIFPGINVATTFTGVTKITNGSTQNRYAFVFIGNKSIDQTILYNNLNNYLTSIDAAMVNS